MTLVSWTLVALAAGALAGVSALAAWLAGRRTSRAEAQTSSSSLGLLQQQFLDLKNELQNQVGTLTHTLHEQLQQGQKSIGERLEGATQAVARVQHQLGDLARTAEHMQEMGRSLTDLQNILKAPKLRGLMGESLLAELLRQVLPESAYSLQHSFRSGVKVDAVIRLGDGLVPVDAKFPLEAFSRMIKAEAEGERRVARREFNTSVRNRITEIADKYILPEEGTYDFALMYIPAENIFYEVILREDGTGGPDLSTYALERKVIPVSPNSFYAYLMAIVYGLKGLRIEKDAQEVFRSVRGLQQGFVQFMETFARLGKQMGHAQNNFDEARRQADRLQDGVIALSGAQSTHAAIARDAAPKEGRLGASPEPVPRPGAERSSTGSL
ncbi:MAG: DNA recombination protein RmuC [Acidobacteria bacterium]|nr:DNA recombination protein RmuC [Acidobacteriota bacterium]